VSWYQLRDIADDNRREAERQVPTPPSVCPIDGELLDVRGGVRNCPLGNYRWG